MKKFALAAAAVALSFAAAPAAWSATEFIGVEFPCSVDDVTDAIACAGFYDKNALANNTEAQQDAFDKLGLGGTPTIIDSVAIDPDNNSGVIDFGQLLFGNTVISIHWGGGNDGPKGKLNGSAMYVFNFATSTASVTTPFGGPLSNARLFSTGSDPCATPGCGGTAIPEPGAWALMILGFGAAGSMLRRRRAALA